MYCRNCGKMMGDSDKFCKECGSQSGESRVETPSGGNNIVADTKTVVDKFLNYIKGMQRNHKIIIGVLIVAVLMVSIGGLGEGGKGIGKSKNTTPEDAFMAALEAVSKEDIDSVKKLMPPENLLDYRESSGFDEESLDTILGDSLRSAVYYLSRDFGKDWAKEIKIVDTVQNSDSEFEVNFELRGNYGSLIIYKIDGKFYVDLDSVL